MLWEQILIALSIALAGISVVLGVLCMRSINRLGSLRVADPQRDLAIDVIVPARNEERDLRSAMQSILGQKSVQLRLFIINDHSSDRTGEIADSIAASDDRVHVIHNPPLKSGWFGKVNAMQHALSASSSPQVLFTDADVIHSRSCFASALAEMQREGIDFLSLAPRFDFESFWENVLLPHTFIAGTVQFLFSDVNDSRTNNAAAAGAFMMTRREVLDQIGGLNDIKSEMLDDVELAKRVKREGFETRLMLAHEQVNVRLFKGNSDAFWGLTKNILGVVGHIWMAVPAMFAPVLFYWVPLATAALGIVQRNPIMIAAGLSAYLAQAALILLSARMCRLKLLKALFFPLAVFPVAACFARALYHRLVSGSVAWRGRVISATGK